MKGLAEPLAFLRRIDDTRDHDATVSHLDPRDPGVLKLLRGMDAESELAARLALNGICPKCRGDRAWKKRIEDLRSVVVHDSDDLAPVLSRSRHAARAIRQALAEEGGG